MKDETNKNRSVPFIDKELVEETLVFGEVLTDRMNFLTKANYYTAKKAIDQPLGGWKYVIYDPTGDYQDGDPYLDVGHTIEAVRDRYYTYHDEAIDKHPVSKLIEAGKAMLDDQYTTSVSELIEQLQEIEDKSQPVYVVTGDLSSAEVGCVSPSAEGAVEIKLIQNEHTPQLVKYGLPLLVETEEGFVPAVTNELDVDGYGKSTVLRSDEVDFRQSFPSGGKVMIQCDICKDLGEAVIFSGTFQELHNSGWVVEIDPNNSKIECPSHATCDPCEETGVIIGKDGNGLPEIRNCDKCMRFSSNGEAQLDTFNKAFEADLDDSILPSFSDKVIHKEDDCE